MIKELGNMKVKVEAWYKLSHKNQRIGDQCYFYNEVLLSM